MEISDGAAAAPALVVAAAVAAAVEAAVAAFARVIDTASFASGWCPRGVYKRVLGWKRSEKEQTGQGRTKASKAATPSDGLAENLQSALLMTGPGS